MKQEIKNKNASEQMRAVRGYAILSKGDTPKQIDKVTFTVPSQNENGEYTITKNGKWKCTCPDFEKRQKECKHIHAVKFWLALQEKVRQNSLPIIEADNPKCPYCNSTDTIKYGKRVCKTAVKQRYGCCACRKRFITEKDFERMKGDAKTTTAILDLYFKGISLRGIQDHLKQFYNLSLDHSNILRRIQKYSKIIDEYVKTLKPEVSNIWHTDEMKIQAGGKWKWLWNVMDRDTRYLITRRVSDKRRIKDGIKVLNEAKETAKKQPTFLITDGCMSYTESVKATLGSTNHIRLKSIRDKRINNNNIERLNGTIRDRIKVMRGLHSEKTADIMASAFANYYNFIRPHSALGITPAQQAGIKIKPEWKELLVKSLNHSLY
jgi:transposase-like protein